MLTLPTGTTWQIQTIDGQRVRCATAYPRADMWERIEDALRAPDPATRLLLQRAKKPITLWHSYDGRLDIMTEDAGFALLENPPRQALAPMVSQQPFGVSVLYALPSWMRRSIHRALPKQWRESAEVAA